MVRQLAGRKRSCTRCNSELIEALENNDTAAGIIPGWVGDISSMVTGSMLLQLKQAASKGTGVIMYTQIIAGTSVTNTWFTPQ